MPFVMHVPKTKTERKLGIAEGKFTIPDDIDKYNEEIATMFEVDVSIPNRDAQNNAYKTMPIDII